MILIFTYPSCDFFHIAFQLELGRVWPTNILRSLNEGLVQIPKFPCLLYNSVNVLYDCMALYLYPAIKALARRDTIAKLIHTLHIGVSEGGGTYIKTSRTTFLPILKHLTVFPLPFQA